MFIVMARRHSEKDKWELIAGYDSLERAEKEIEKHHRFFYKEFQIIRPELIKVVKYEK